MNDVVKQLMYLCRLLCKLFPGLGLNRFMLLGLQSVFIVHSLARDSDARDFGRPEQFLDGSTTLTGNLSEAVERFER